MPYKVQNPHLGPGGKIETFNETAWPNNRSQLGYVYEKGPKAWQAFNLVDAAAPNGQGDLYYVKNYASYTATPTIGNSSVHEVAGVAEGALLINSFAYLRIRGPINVKAKGAPTAAFAKGLQVFSDTANNQVDAVASAALPLAKPIGIAQAAVATTAQGVTGVAGKVVVHLTIDPV